LQGEEAVADFGYTAPMLMVIFGAGASYDSAQAYKISPSVDDGPWRPPLARDLFLDRHHAFGKIVTRYSKLAHILPYLREASQGNVEETLEVLQEQGKDYPERQRELAAVRFYLCDLLRTVTDGWISQTNGVTNYAPLLGEILRSNQSNEQVCLVTFNYDSLLEHALYSFDFKRREPKDHLGSHPILKLFKLHGSIDWARIVDVPHGTRIQPQGLIEQADTITLTDEFVSADATDPRQLSNFGRPIFPAIAIPVQTKSDQHFECPKSHLDHFVTMLPHITKILIVGWQAREAHFLRMLHSKLPRLKFTMVVGANKQDAEQTFAHLVSEFGILPPFPSFGQGGFTDFIINREGHDFFRKM
jgi:hypothetical protein